MKLTENHFEDYLHNYEKNNLHPKLKKIYMNFPEKIINLKNIIFYGPSGVGKYTQMLASIKKYSPSGLKYEKKISIPHNKNTYFLKISDIHFEVDMSLLGCNSKILWMDIYNQFIDIISAKVDNVGIIVCKFFHEINSELLETFYSFMQTNNNNINIKFILLTEQLSFIPDNIYNCCEIISIPRPTKNQYNKCLVKNLSSNIKLEEISNIKNISNEKYFINIYKNICDEIIDKIINIKEMKFLIFRDILYKILIFNLNIPTCIWYILSTLIRKKHIKKTDLSDILKKTFNFFQYYNNNYRPIYHLENYIFYLIIKIHGF
jgi:hypothetical protein